MCIIMCGGNNYCNLGIIYLTKIPMLKFGCHSGKPLGHTGTFSRTKSKGTMVLHVCLWKRFWNWGFFLCLSLWLLNIHEWIRFTFPSWHSIMESSKSRISSQNVFFLENDLSHISATEIESWLTWFTMKK